LSSGVADGRQALRSPTTTVSRLRLSHRGQVDVSIDAGRAASDGGGPARIDGPPHRRTRSPWDEGEGDRTRASWLAAHERFFRRYLPSIGVAFDPDRPTVFERFDVMSSE
jgi:hypothetical protein